MSIGLAFYADLLDRVKTRIREGQTRAVQAVTRELLCLYWDLGRLLVEKQGAEGWGAGVLRRLSNDLKNELPETKGFSKKNLKLMTQFFREYPGLFPIGKPVVAQLPWAHHVLLMQKVKSMAERLWYMGMALEQGWSRNVLHLMIESQAHRRQGRAITNFAVRLPPPQSDLARQSLKDPYIFDFLTLAEPYHERELEMGLLQHLERFLLELGQGFAFVGRQYHLDIGGEDFYIDLLFYHLRLRCFVVIELKKGGFKPEYAGKMNFYLNALDDRLKHSTDHPTIVLILCQEKNRVVAEYALGGVDKPIGVSEYEIIRALPAEMKSALPTIEEIEAELAPAPKTRHGKRKLKDGSEKKK
jgi:predicted nuclease of restriction endonuclease-like (RecB) superfamily